MLWLGLSSGLRFSFRVRVRRRFSVKVMFKVRVSC